MRAALSVLLAAAVGIHCSGPDPYAEDGMGGGEAVGTEEPVRAAPPPDEDAADPRWPRSAEAGPPSIITTTAHGDGGALYAAGTFRGWLVVDDEAYRSKGEDDVFLVRYDADGRIAWVRTIGSVRAERMPKVTFVDGEVKLMARTDGEVDCGSGAMAKWSSEMFFYCMYDAEGAALGGGSFPTGSP